MVDGKVYISNVNSLAALCDRLAVEVHKIAWFENKKREEQKRANPDYVLVAEWDDKSRDACELRSLIKQEIDSLFQHVVKTGKYTYAKEVRTFSPTPRAAQMLEEMYAKCASASLNGELAAAFERELNDNS